MKRFFTMSIFLVLFLTSCSFFTTSWGTSFTRDSKKAYKKMSTNELAKMLSSSETIVDLESQKEIISILGDKDDFLSLSKTEKENILNTTTNASISPATIANIMESVKSSGDKERMKNLLQDVLNQIEPVDSRAASKILGDTENLLKLEPTSAAFATICVIAQVAKKQNLPEETRADSITKAVQEIASANYDDPIQYVDVVNTQINNLFGSGLNEETKEVAKSAFNAIGYFYKHDAEVMPDVKLSDLIPKK